MTAVKIAPTKIPTTGLLAFVIKLTNVSDCWSGCIASPIIPIPMNNTPSPAKISLIWRTRSFFTNVIAATPPNAISGAIAPMSSAISCPVIVVPILAPMITQTA